MDQKFQTFQYIWCPFNVQSENLLNMSSIFNRSLLSVKGWSFRCWMMLDGFRWFWVVFTTIRASGSIKEPVLIPYRSPEPWNPGGWSFSTVLFNESQSTGEEIKEARKWPSMCYQMEWSAVSNGELYYLIVSPILMQKLCFLTTCLPNKKARTLRRTWFLRNSVFQFGR